MRDLADPRPASLLLVSVRDTLEAARAIAGGCQILDVKEPSRGSLGFAGIERIGAVAAVGNESGLPVSAALGEVAEWRITEVPRLPEGLRFAKLGLAQLSQRLDWLDAWSDLRRRFDPRGQLGWIAVAYGDWQIAGAPRPDEVVDAALETGCAGVLFDTWDKGQPRLTELIDLAQLDEWIRRIQGAGLLAGLAGRLDGAQLGRLAAKPDIVAVRSAACERGDRKGPISMEAVRRLRRALREGASQPTSDG